MEVYNGKDICAADCVRVLLTAYKRRTGCAVNELALEWIGRLTAYRRNFPLAITTLEEMLPCYVGNAIFGSTEVHNGKNINTPDIIGTSYAAFMRLTCWIVLVDSVPTSISLSIVACQPGIVSGCCQQKNHCLSAGF